MDDIEKIVQNNLQVIEELHHKIIELEKRLGKYSNDDPNLNGMISDLKVKNEELEASIQECSDRINTCRNCRIDENIESLSDIESRLDEISTNISLDKSCGTVNNKHIKNIKAVLFEVMRALWIKKGISEDTYKELKEKLDSKQETITGKFQESGKVYDFEGTIKPAESDDKYSFLVMVNDGLCKTNEMLLEKLKNYRKQLIAEVIQDLDEIMKSDVWMTVIGNKYEKYQKKEDTEK